MRILIHKVRDGVRDIMVVPARGARLAPVLVRGTERDAVMQKVEEVVAAVDVRERETRRPTQPS